MKIKNKPLFIALNILQKAVLANAPVPQCLLFVESEDVVELMEPNEAPKNLILFSTLFFNACFICLT